MTSYDLEHFAGRVNPELWGTPEAEIEAERIYTRSLIRSRKTVIDRTSPRCDYLYGNKVGAVCGATEATHDQTGHPFQNGEIE